ncbi:MAG: GMC oxidoreductase [Microbacterium sp.]
MTHPDRADVLIVGGGIMGAIVARLLREGDPTVRIVMLDAGEPIGPVAGMHLHDIEDPEIWERYNTRVASGVQGMYTGAEVVREVPESIAMAEPGMFHALAFGEDAEAMPAAALAWNAGGMGVHWTAACPWPWGEEVFDRSDEAQWHADLQTARRVLDVRSTAIGPTAVGERVLEVLERRYGAVAAEGRHPQPMPMAVRPAGALLRRTSPATIFPPIASGGDSAFEYLPGVLVTALVHEDGHVAGARVRMPDGAERMLAADRVVVCGDTMRTPQLLFASGIRPEALGRYLNEHAFITSQVIVDLDRFGLTARDLPLTREGEFCTDSLWLPQNGPDQPFHGQIMNRTFIDEDGRPLGHAVGVSLYTPVDSRPENRLVFDPTETDLAGMPRIRVEFSYSDADRARIDRAMDEIASLAEEFGEFHPETERALLVPGSSLHQTGTVRSGTADDGTSVCDPTGRVWSFDNLYLAGNGVVPTPVVANATLTGAVTAVRAARALLAAGIPVPAAASDNEKGTSCPC